jgi:hypothetical protein
MVSFEFRPYPDATQQCALCKRFDCSKGDEPWLHLLTIETDGGYTPAIGHNCLRAIVANSAFGKPQVIEKVITRDPTDEEIGAYVRRLFDDQATQSPWKSETKLKAVVKSDGSGSSDDERNPEPRARRNPGPRTHSASKRAEGTD